MELSRTNNNPLIIATMFSNKITRSVFEFIIFIIDENSTHTKINSKSESRRYWPIKKKKLGVIYAC